MANNRLYIRCRNCGQTIFLAKHFSTPWDLRRNSEDIQEFFNQHYACENEFDYGDDNECYFENSFQLVTEFGDGYPKITDGFLTEDNRFFTRVKGSESI